jgi:hypothetical protein
MRVADATLRLTRADVTDDEVVHLREHGFVVFPEAIDPRLLRDLTREAVERHSLASPWGSEEYVLRPNGQLASPRRHLTARPGPHLRRLEAAADLRDVLGVLVAGKVRPARASYIYYWPGDYVGLHTDIVPDCRLTLLTSVLGHLDPLVVHPNLAGRRPDELLALSRRTGGFPSGGTPVGIPRNGFLLLAGSALPHHRPVSTGPPCGLAALCFAAA